MLSKDMDAALLAALPPSSIPTEEAILGACLLDPRAVDRVSGCLTKEMFYVKAHALIWEAILATRSAFGSVDFISVLDRLTQAGNLDVIGGHQKLTSLIGATPSSANIEAYAALVAEKSLRRRLIAAAREIEKAAIGGAEFSGVIESAQKKIFEIASAKPEESGMRMADAMTEALDRLDKISNGEIQPAIPTGLNALDKMIVGLDHGSLCIIAGRPSMGKSALAMQIAHTISRRVSNPNAEGLERYQTVAVFSLEMDSVLVAQRIWAIESSIPSNQIRSANLSDTEHSRLLQAFPAAAESGMYLDTRSNPSVEQIATTCRQLHMKNGGIGAIVIDYLQLMIKGEDPTRELGRITRQLKILAGELNCPIILLSQLNRSVESRQNKRPMMSDLRESGAIEQDADLVAMIYRDEYYNPDTPDRGIAEIIITKNRNGSTGTAKLNFDASLTRFSDIL